MSSITRMQAAKKLNRPYSTIAYWCRQLDFTGNFISDGEFNHLKDLSNIAIRKSNKHKSKIPRKLSAQKKTKRKAQNRKDKDVWIRPDTIAIVIQDVDGQMELVTREVFMQEWLEEGIQDTYPNGIFLEVSAISKAHTAQVMTLERISVDDAKGYAKGM